MLWIHTKALNEIHSETERRIFVKTIKNLAPKKKCAGIFLQIDTEIKKSVCNQQIMTVRKAAYWNFLSHYCWAIESDGKAIFILSNIIALVRGKWKCFQETFSLIYTNLKWQICACCSRSVKSMAGTNIQT